jgi:hypothetical protein
MAWLIAAAMIVGAPPTAFFVTFVVLVAVFMLVAIVVSATRATFVTAATMLRKRGRCKGSDDAKAIGHTENQGGNSKGRLQ